MNNLRILHIALNDAYKENPITRAMRESGALVYEIDWRKTLGEMQTFNHPIFWHNVVECVRMMRPQIVFMQIAPELVDPKIANQIKQLSFLINWTGDVRNEMDWMTALAPAVSLSLFTNTKHVEEFRAAGWPADYLQVGFDESVYQPVTNFKIPVSDQVKKTGLKNNVGDKVLVDSKYAGIVFLGNNFVKRPNTDFELSVFRAEMVQRLKGTFQEQFHVYGTGWGEDVIPLVAVDEAICYRSCTMAINLSHYNYGRYSSDRLLRIMACGALALTHRFPDIEMDFTDGKNVVVWDSIDDLIEKCSYYLKPENKEEGEKIAAAGAKLAHRHCSWSARMRELYPICDKYTTIKGNDDWIGGMKTVTPEKTHSQYGEESYLGYIFNFGIGTTNKFFVDFGAGDGYALSNTRFFKEKMGWDGLMMDADNKGNEEVKKHFIDKDNIIQLLDKYNVSRDFDLLSIDMDGNDYYILDELLKKYSPRVIIAEFNGTIPENDCRTIVYNKDHVWNNNDYYGFSFRAGLHLAELHGYKVIHQTNSTNMYMIKKSEMANPDIAIPVNYTAMQYHARNTEGKWFFPKAMKDLEKATID